MMASEVENVFTDLLAMCISCSVNCLLRRSSHFLISAFMKAKNSSDLPSAIRRNSIAGDVIHSQFKCLRTRGTFVESKVGE